MKRLAMLCVLAAVLGVCSQSYGYVLVYDIGSQVRAVDTDTNLMDRTMVRGTLVVDINETLGAATAGELVLFHKDWDANGVYTVSDKVGITIYGNLVVAVIDTNAPGGHIIMTGNTGRMWGRNIGLADRKNVAYMLNGSIQLNGGVLFDPNESLVGTGDISAILDFWQTRSANMNGDSVGDVVDGIITFLQSRGFTGLLLVEPMPV
jgi:hypothetical protein